MRSSSFALVVIVVLGLISNEVFIVQAAVRRHRHPDEEVFEVEEAKRQFGSNDFLQTIANMLLPSILTAVQDQISTMISQQMQNLFSGINFGKKRGFEEMDLEQLVKQLVEEKADQKLDLSHSISNLAPTPRKPIISAEKLQKLVPFINTEFLKKWMTVVADEVNTEN